MSWANITSGFIIILLVVSLIFPQYQDIFFITFLVWLFVLTPIALILFGNKKDALEQLNEGDEE